MERNFYLLGLIDQKTKKLRHILFTGSSAGTLTFNMHKEWPIEIFSFKAKDFQEGQKKLKETIERGSDALKWLQEVPGYDQLF